MTNKDLHPNTFVALIDAFMKLRKKSFPARDLPKNCFM